MGTFSDIAAAKAGAKKSDEGEFMVGGQYKLVLKRLLYESSQKPGKSKEKMLKLFFTVKEFIPDDPKAGFQFKPGMVAKTIRNTFKEAGAMFAKRTARDLGEQALWAAGVGADKVKEFLNDFRDTDEEPNPSEKHLEQLLVNNSPLIGLEVEAIATNQPLKDEPTKNFTNIRWLVTNRPEDFDPRG